jgi:hypothetical protein
MSIPAPPSDVQIALHESHLTPLTLDQPGGEVARLVHDGADRIYWSTHTNLRSFTISTSKAVDLLLIPTHGVDRIKGIALDQDGSLYFAQHFYVRRCASPASTCTPAQVALLGVQVTDVALAADFIYILGHDGSVWRKRR